VRAGRLFTNATLRFFSTLFLCFVCHGRQLTF
jgi:hypothetical protein